MITKTETYVRFLYTENGYEYSKTHDNELDFYEKIQVDVPLETYLESVIAQKTLISAAKAERIKVYQTIYYDRHCSPELSPKTIALLQELGATIELTMQRNFEGETLYQVLDKMRERPAMYIGEYSITALYHFIQGFFMACDGGTKEVPSFNGFNDFVGEYYGKYTTAGWKDLILSDHFGNEQEALRHFYTLLDAFRAMSNTPSSRDIVHRLLYVAFLHFRGESNEIGKKMMQDDDDLVKNAKEIRQELWKINRVADLLHNTTNPLKRATYSFEYDDILQHIFNRAFNYRYLHEYIKRNAPEAAFYEHQLWETKENGEIAAIKTSELANATPNVEQKTLLQSFFAINDEAVNELKEHFIRNKQQRKIMQKHNLTFFTEYYQFYILDSETKSQTDDANFWNDEAGKLRLAVLEGLLGVTVGKYAEINVEVRVLEEKPSIFDYPDHVVEASLRLPSGILQIKDCTGYDTELELKLEKGCYRVRISSFKLYTIQNDSGDDHYLVEIWKSRFAKPKVLVDYKRK